MAIAMFRGELNFASFKAGASFASSQYFAAKMDTTYNQVVLATANSKNIGIIVDTPASGGDVSICIAGICKCEMGESSLAMGALLTSTSTGALEQVDAAGEFISGLLVDTADSGETGSCLVMHSVAQASDV